MMGIRCVLFGHDWSKFETIIDPCNPYDENGNPVAEVPCERCAATKKINIDRRIIEEVMGVFK